MTRRYVFGAMFLSSRLIVCGTSLAQQVPSTSQYEVEARPPGLMSIEPNSVIVTFKPGLFWLGNAIDKLALRYGKILVRCGLPDEVRESRIQELSGQSFHLPDNLSAMRQIAALSDSELVELSPEVVLLNSRKVPCDGPLTITAEHVSGLGIPLDPNIDVHVVEMGLFQTGLNRQAGPETVSSGPRWNAIYYWASREGSGRELYVQQQSSTDFAVNAAPGRWLRKVAVENVGGRLDIRDLWTDAEPSGRLITGPVAELELDFDGDGIVDVVCFSGSPGYDGAVGPLHVLSGKTGREIGKIEGFEIVIVEGAGGQRRFKTLDRDGYRTYGLTEDGKLGMEHFVRADADTAEPLLVQVQGTPQGRATVLGLKANEKVVDDFLVTPPTSSNPNAFRRLRVLKLVGEHLRLPPGGAKSLKDTHILLEYRPK